MNPFDDAALDRLKEILSRTPAEEITKEGHRRACVVAPIFKSDGGYSLLFCKRSKDLPAHSGQIAFPGGGALEGEKLEDAARRETEEEVGIPAARVELIGRLDDLITVSGYIVAPFVGVIPPNFEYLLQASEEDEVYEVPLEALLDSSNPEVRLIDYRGRRYPSYFYHWQGLEIWGLTGRMVKALLDLVRLAL